MLIHMKMPFIGRLKAHNWSMFAIVGTMGPDDVDVTEIIILDVIEQCLADFLASAFLALLTRADVKDFRWNVFVFAHRLVEHGEGA